VQFRAEPGDGGKVYVKAHLRERRRLIHPFPTSRHALDKRPRAAGPLLLDNVCVRRGVAGLELLALDLLERLV